MKLNSYLKKEFLFGVFLVFYFSTFTLSNVGLSAFIRLIELILTLSGFFLVNKCKKNIKELKISFIVFIFFILSITLSILRDTGSDYSSELYFKTIYYIISSYGIALLFFYLYSNHISYSKKIRARFYNGLLVGISVIGFLVVYLAFKNHWAFGQTLIGSEIGGLYQGLSRMLSLLILLLVLLRDKVTKFLYFSMVFTFFVLMLSFNSFGAFVAILIAIFIIFTSIKRKLTFFIGFSFCLLLLVLSFEYFKELPVYQLLIDRMLSKFDNSTVEEQSRYWLLMKGYEIWSRDLSSVVLGVGPFAYSCYVDFCSGYRHPHNLLLINLVWFGVFGFLLFFSFFYTFCRSVSHLLNKSTGLSIKIISALFINYFLLSLFGGDFEQNRHLIFLWFVLILIGNSVNETK